ncbi:hypothetical protein CVD28_01140 [Bacillus sp. M6-12]|uniref:DUF4652 domain-containing protein n=1 Tax=Bacillus sp. M6-12 TaxID=2054166 RepID=UPI000C7907D7|nr:DUF4652 domain-containing protein [Bacillus sp. M6-12]PLS19039.1 hypothetical protein CVD28_01140 [Bacillus sp. M6-12]
MKHLKKTLMVTALVSSTLLFTACDATENEGKGTETAQAPSTQEKDKKESTSSIVTDNKETVAKEEETNVTKVEGNAKEATPTPTPTKTDNSKPPTTQVEKKKTVDLFNVEENKEYEASFHSGWKASPSAKKQATIDGRGEGAVEEGQALLVVQDKEKGYSNLYSMKESSNGQSSPKYVEWIDENRLYVIIGFAYGTVSKGGELYELNLRDHSLTPVITGLKDNEEVVSIKQDKKGNFIYEKHIYDDENLTVGHFEEGTLPISTTK